MTPPELEFEYEFSCLEGCLLPMGHTARCVTTNGWIRVTEQLPPKGLVVDTKVHDGGGERPLKRGEGTGHLWFQVDGSMDTYYEPTHWRVIEEVEQ